MTNYASAFAEAFILIVLLLIGTHIAVAGWIALVNP
jgi:hypothetical protein